MSPTCSSDKGSMKMKVIREHCWSDTGDSGINVGTFMEHCWSDTGDSDINVGTISAVDTQILWPWAQ